MSKHCDDQFCDNTGPHIQPIDCWYQDDMYDEDYWEDYYDAQEGLYTAWEIIEANRG